MAPKSETWSLTGTLKTIAIAGVLLAVVGCGGQKKDTSADRGGSGGSGKTVRPAPTRPVRRPGSGERTPPSQPVPALEVSRADVVAMTPDEVKTQRDLTVVAKVLIEADEPKSRRVAARTLGREGGFDTLPVLLEALLDEDLTVRVYAISAINDISHMRYSYNPKASKHIRDQQARDLAAYFKRRGVIE